jgi:hypothetical protein
LARVTAHEAGHYFLNINTNTAHTSGLMREGFTGSAWSLPASAGSFQFTRLQALLLGLRCPKGEIQTTPQRPSGNIMLRPVPPPNSGALNTFRILDIYFNSLALYWLDVAWRRGEIRIYWGY